MRRLARSPKRWRNKRKLVSGSRITLPENFAYKPELSINPLARVTLAVGLPYLLVNRALASFAAVTGMSNFGTEAECSYNFLQFEAENVFKIFSNLHGTCI